MSILGAEEGTASGGSSDSSSSSSSKGGEDGGGGGVGEGASSSLAQPAPSMTRADYNVYQLQSMTGRSRADCLAAMEAAGGDYLRAVNALF